MKLRRLELEGFRGAPQPLPIKFSEKTSFVFSENGRGKSTLADGLEFLTSGDLLDFHREGCGLDAAVNLDSSSGARIEADVIGPNAHLKRTLTPQAVGALETDPADLDVAPIPILRQSTINAFMRQTAGEKRQALLELLDLDALNAFRRALRTALGNAKERRVAAERSRGEEEATLKALLGGSDLIARAGELAANAKLEEKITSEAQLDGLKLKLPPGEPNREAPLTDLTRALESLQDDPAPVWNEAVADAGIRGAEALAALLEQGKRVLDGDWDADACPLCEVAQDHDQLATQVKARAEVLAESRRKVAELREQLKRASDSSERLAATIDAILKVAPDGGWPSEDDLKAAAGSLRAYARELARAGADFEPCPSFPELDLDFAALMPLLHVAAAPKESPELAALQALNELQGQRRRLANRTKGAIGAQGDERALARLLEIADEKIKDAVEDALAGIADLVERYFGVLMANPIYSDVKLVYAARRSGQVEFQISYGPHAVNPPQRVMSESQLNALGLALLLARVKQSETPWRSLVLDDVVNSFDAAHRSGLVRLLRQEFAEWQLVILSHDPLFRDIAQREAAGEWEFREVVAWTPAGGPVLGEGDPLNRLDQGLKAGESAAALGGHARRALEQNLSRALGRLGYKIPFDPAGRYTSHDYLQALRSGFAEKGSVLAGSDVLRRIASGDYMATRIVHSRSDVPEAGSAELTHLVADLRDFDAMLCCDGCGKRVWYAKTNKGHQCECGKLKA
jgi:hypothetical protein